MEVVGNFFESMSIHVSQLWLTSFVDWFREQNQGVNYTDRELKVSAYEQWLLTDLRDIEVCSLPPNLNRHKEIILTDSYAIQVMAIKDISKPRLTQLQTIRKQNYQARIEESENPAIGKRMLQLLLTDGVQELIGFEYTPVEGLSINMKPGIKILLIGPLRIRRGRILLKPGNVKVLGGEVEDILVSNAAENILARELRLSENPDPYSVVTDGAAVQVNASVSSANITHGIGRSNHNPSTISGAENSTNNTSPGPTARSAAISTDSVTPDIEVSDFLFHEEMQLNDEIENMLEIEREIEREASRVADSNTNARGADTPESDQDLFANNDVSRSENPQPVLVSPSPYVYIKQLNRNRSYITNDRFAVKARFVRVVEKLTAQPSGLSMKFEITDDTDTLVVGFSNSVIEQLMELTIESVLELRAENRQKNPDAFEKLMNALNLCKLKLQQTSSVLHLQFCENETEPKIIKIEDSYNPQLITLLPNRTTTTTM